MKLLFDQNISPKLSDHFKDTFKEAVHIQDLNLDSAGDIELWEYARSNNFTIVTKDSDFNHLVSLYGFPPKVIWIRRGNCTTKQIQDMIKDHIEGIRLFINDSENGIFTLI